MNLFLKNWTWTSSHDKNLFSHKIPLFLHQMIHTRLISYDFLTTKVWEICNTCNWKPNTISRNCNNLNVTCNHELPFLPLYQSALWCFKGILWCAGLTKFTKYAQEKTFAALQRHQRIAWLIDLICRRMQQKTAGSLSHNKKKLFL